jgi:hypothetical protein
MDIFRLCFLGDDLLLSACLLGAFDGLCAAADTGLVFPLSGVPEFELMSIVLSAALALLFSPKAASKVSARLCTPYELSLCLLPISVSCELPSDCSISSLLLRRKVVGTWLEGPL